MSSHPGPATSSSDINRSSGCLSLKSGKIFEEEDLWWRHGTAACLTHKNRSRSPILERSFINYLLIIFIIIYFMVLSFSLSLFFSFSVLGTFCVCSLATRPGDHVWCNVMFYASHFSWKIMASGAICASAESSNMMSLSKSIGLIGSAVLALRFISSSR